MGRTAKISVSVGALAALAIFAAAVLLATPIGPRLMKPRIEAALSDALGHAVAIGASEGPISAVRLRDITVSDSDGAFATIDLLSLDWKPMQALSRRYVIDAVHIDGGELLRQPAASQERAAFKGLKLPDNLPTITIGDLAVADFTIAPTAAGRAVIITASGRAEIGAEKIAVDFNLEGNDRRDTIRVEARTDGGNVTLDARIASSADGAIAALAEAGGPIDLAISGTGPLSAFSAQATGKVGAFASIDIVAAADLAQFRSVAVNGMIDPGEKLASVRGIVGARADVDLVITPEPNGARLRVNRVAGGFGVASGAAQWRNRGEKLDAAEITIALALDDAFRPDLARFAGRDIAGAARLSRAGDAWRISLDAKSETGALTIDNARTNLETTFLGEAKLTAAANAAAPAPLAAGFTAAGSFDIDRADTAKASALRIRTADGSAFDGAAAYAFAGGAIRINGAAVISAKDAARVAPGLLMRAPTTLTIAANGRRDAFTLKATGAAPASRFRGAALAPIALAVDAAGALEAFRGSIRVREKGGAGALDAVFARGPGDAFVVSALDYRGRGFSLTGSASGDAAARRVNADLVYRGDATASPLPGVTLAGDARVRIDVSGNAADNRISLVAQSLSTSGWSISALSLNAAGPLKALRIEARAGAATAGAALAANAIETRLTANLDDAPRATIEALTMELAGEPVALAAPARIAFGDAVALDGLSLTVGRRGSLALDGAFARDRWRAEVKAERVPIGDGSAAMTLAARLDTAEPEAASGSFALRSRLTADRRAIEGAFVWDGKTVRVADAGDDPALDFELAAPLRLVRGDRLSVDATGALSGRARYDGPLEIVAPLLPSFAQSLSGKAVVEARLSGATDRPALDGVVAITDATYTEVSTGLAVLDIDARAEATGDASGTRIVFSGDAAGAGQKRKTIAAKAVYDIGRASNLRADITLDGANLPAAPITEMIADGALTLEGPPGGLKLSGEIVARRLDAELIPPEPLGLVEINVVALDRPVSAQDAAREPAAAPIAYDIRARAPSRAVVRGRGLESEWRADLSISGNAAAPLVLGSLSLIEGRLDFSGRRFEIEEGVMQFDRLVANDPLIRIVAAVDTDGVVARIKIAGRASAPQISLESTPALPTDDIVARMLFGKPAAELSALESLQAAQALANLGAVGPFGGGEGVAGSARRAIGLDLLSLDLEADTGASSLTVGKYLTDDIFVSAQQDARGENGAIRVEFEVTNAISVETEIKQDGEQTVSANWKKDF